MAGLGKGVVILAMAAFLMTVGVFPALAATNVNVLQVIDVPPEMGYKTMAFGMNDVGDVVGSYIDNSYREHGFHYNLDNKIFTPIDPPGYDGSIMWIMDINNQGEMVGGYQTQTGSYHCFRYDGQDFTAFDVPMGTGGYQGAWGINDQGHLVGPYTDTPTQAVRGFLYDGSYTSMNFQNAAATFVNDINNHGHMVGFTSGNPVLPVQNGASFFHDGTTYYPLQQLASTMCAMGLNDADQVVGFLTDENFTSSHGFLYDHNTQQYLELSVDGSSFTDLRGINNQGQMVGYFRDAGDGKLRGFVAVVPVPPSLILLGSGLLGLGLLGRRRRPKS